MLVRLIPFDLYEPIRVLDIGAGHGALTRAILESFRRSHVVCQDFPKTSFAHARQHLKLQYDDRVSCLDSDISRRGWDYEALGPFDTIVSALAINKAERAQRIPVLYNEIFSLLRNGGCFFNWDAVAQLESSSPAPPSLVSHLFWLRRAGFSDLFFWTEKEQAVFGGYRFEVEG